MTGSIVIVGAGQAGYHTAAGLRREGFSGKLTLVGDEPGAPYQRPPLSKGYLLGKTGKDSLLFRPAAFYAENDIALVNDSAVAIDKTNRSVLTGSGLRLGYDHLVLAVGAHNRKLSVPGSGRAGVMYLRTMEDADRLAERLTPLSRVVIAGAGFVGLELASTVVARGASAHVLDLADRPMARALTEPMAGAFARLHSESGVRLLFRQGLAAVTDREGRVDGVVTTQGGTIPADTVIVGIGIVPNTRLAEEAGLDTENGIKVDGHLVTSDPAISAVGDCANFPWRDSHLRLESVQNATDQARIVAARLTGKRSAYDPVPWFWSDQYDVKLQIAGIAQDIDETVVLGDQNTRSFSVACFSKSRLAAVESMNKAGDHMAARRLLGRATSLSPEEASRPGFTLTAFEAGTR